MTSAGVALEQLGLAVPAPAAPAGQTLDPVELMIERDHAFKKKDPDPDSGRKRVGCEVCGRAKRDIAHLGAPPSLNDGGSGMDRMAFYELKKTWQAALTSELDASGLPKGLAFVSVEGLIGFPTLAERDQGNYRWMIEKALGDALVEGGWLVSDCFFPVSRYEFCGLQAVHAPRRSWLRLLLFPRA